MCYNAPTLLMCMSVHMSVGSMNVYVDVEARGQFHNIRCLPGLFKVLCVGVFCLNGCTIPCAHHGCVGTGEAAEPLELELSCRWL